MGSIITSMFGLLSSVGGVLMALDFVELGAVLVALGTGGMGVAARDNNKTSEDVHAK